MIVRFSVKKLATMGMLKNVKIAPYIPDFKRGLDHFCIHAGEQASGLMSVF
jgi:hypothetical protein